MDIYAVVLTISGEAGQEINRLRTNYSEFMNYRIEPHITLEFPFVPSVDLATVNQRLEAAAQRTRPFTLIMSGIKYFEAGNNVAYVAIENEEPVITLHRDIHNSLSGILTGEHKMEYALERYTPHVTICEHIPDDVFPRIKRDLAEYQPRYRVEVVSLDLYSTTHEETYRIWQPIRSFQLTGM
jgi:2'-5' RNA ligase